MRGELPVLGAGALDDVLQVHGGAGARTVLEGEALPRFVGRQRWFSAKARTIDHVRLDTHGPLPHVGPAASDGVARWMLFGSVVFADGPGDRYVLPVIDLPPDAAAAFLDRHPGAAIAWVDEPGGRLIADGMLDDEVCRALLAVIRASGRLPLTTGTLAGTHHAGPDIEHGAPIAEMRVRRTGAEQSNSSVIFGSHAIFKLFRRIEPGPHPEIEVGRHLGRAGFRAAPAVLGTIEYTPTDRDARSALGVLHALVQNEGDGWAHALRDVDAFLGRVSAHPDFRSIEAAGDRPRGLAPGPARELVGMYVEAAGTLGRQTAGLHLALSRALGEEAFEPEPLDPGDMSRVAEGTRDRAARALAQLARAMSQLPPAAAARGRELLAAQPRLFERLDALAAARIDAARIRVHQDYHLGQTLWTGRDYVILDFEGEPLRPLAERRVKRSPLTDVAGMLRSYSYAAWSGLFSWCRATGRDPFAQDTWAGLWETTVSEAFLHAYRETAGDASFVPRDDAAFDLLLRGLMLEKAVYELEYELNNRPDWLPVPVEGLLRLL